MQKKTFLPALVILLAIAFSTVAVGQEMKKEEGKKEGMVLKSVTCDPACGFMVRSHDEAELATIVKEHAKKVHKMDMTDAQVKEKMKTEKMGKKGEMMKEGMKKEGKKM